MALLLALAAWATFRPVIHGRFLRWDDDLQIQNNEALGPLSARGVAWAFTDFDTAARYIPLTLMGWMANVSAAGKSPLGFHLVNVLLHAANTMLVFALAHRLLRAKGAPAGFGPLVCAAAGAAFWSLHPMRVEPVAWATTRTYCQALFFLLLSVHAYLGVLSPEATPRGRRWRYGASLVAYAASLLSYPAGLGFVVALAAIDVFLLVPDGSSGAGRRNSQVKRALLLKVPYVLAAGCVLALALAARLHSSKVFPGAAPLSEFGLTSRAAQAFYLWAYYAWRPIVPIGLSPVQTTLVHFSPLNWVFVASAIGVMLLTATLFASRRQRPGLLALWICHLALLFPMLGWTEHPHFPADRYSLVVGTLWAVAISTGLWSIWRREKTRSAAIALACLLAAVTAGLAVMSFRLTSVWRDSETFFSFILRKLGDDPYRADILVRRSVDRAAQGDADAAERDLFDAVAADPGHDVARMLLAGVLLDRGKTAPAAKVAAEGVVRRPDSADFRYLYGAALSREGRDREAAEQIEEAMRLRPQDARFPPALQAIRARLADQPRAVP